MSIILITQILFKDSTKQCLPIDPKSKEVSFNLTNEVKNDKKKIKKNNFTLKDNTETKFRVENDKNGKHAAKNINNKKTSINLVEN